MNETTEKWGFIVNPIAGNYSAKKIVSKLKEEITKHGISAEIVYTESPGHAVDLALSFLEKEF